MSKKIFGKTPRGSLSENISRSANFNKGQFQNIHFTPDISEDTNYACVIYDFLFAKHPRRTPTDRIPSVKTNLVHLPKNEDILVWFGHSSYFMQIDGKTFLVDPVFSGNAAPVKGSTKAFKGTDIYTPQDFPDIDVLIITHDHYDHLDYKTVLQLKPKVKKVICGLGVSNHFEYWGYDARILHEFDWWEDSSLNEGFHIYTTPGRHFSGRSLKRNRSLWMSYVLQTPSLSIFIGGDSGYDTHFAEIGDKHGPFDLAILENGQYNTSWKYIHMQPEETYRAAKDLRAKRLLPVHSGKFSLAPHPWDEPLIRITALSKNEIIPVLTPMIGEKLELKNENQRFQEWWKGIN